MRRIFTAALSALLGLYFCACAFADAMLYRGQSSVGAVPSFDNNSVLCVSLEDLGRMLGFNPQRENDELSLSRGNAVVRVSLGATAGWYGYSIIPLYSAPFEKDGKFWVDSRSAATLFQRFSGKGAANRLRFAKIEGHSAIASNERDYGDFGETEEVQTAKKPKPSIDLNEIINRTVQTNQNPRQPQTAQLPQYQTHKDDSPSQSQARKVDRPSQTRARKIESESQNQQPAITASSQKSQPTITASAQNSQPVIKESAKKSSGKSQPRMETFSPDDSKTDDGENYSGTIHGIRWTASEGTHKKIRAVVMADEDSDPQVYMDGGKLHALFASSLENSKSIASPYAENVKAEIKSNIDGAELIFTPEGITKAEKLVLNNPRRIVFDFFYPDDANIDVPQPEATKTDIQLPGQVTETQKAETPAQTQPSIFSSGNPDPVIISSPAPKQARTPATMTPPSLITIPTSPQSTERLRVNKNVKTIVIDPGHGGKDPGAMDNGVMEKDVNLAVGLELQKALTARGYNAVMTRADDTYLKLQERTDIANNVEADLFVSVHVNALPKKKSMSGFEIYIMALPTDKDAMELAKVENREYVEGKGMDTENVDRRTEMLLRILGDLQQNNKISESTNFAAMLYNAGVRNGLPMRRVAQAPFFVLRGAGMPAVLLEIGFVTNANESQLLTTPAYQQRIANAMSEGIANYIK